MSTELNRLKEAFRAWVAEDPAERDGKLLTRDQADEIVRRADKLQRQIDAGAACDAFLLLVTILESLK